MESDGGLTLLSAGMFRHQRAIVIAEDFTRNTVASHAVGHGQEPGGLRHVGADTHVRFSRPCVDRLEDVHGLAARLAGELEAGFDKVDLQLSAGLCFELERRVARPVDKQGIAGGKEAPHRAIRDLKALWQAVFGRVGLKTVADNPTVSLCLGVQGLDLFLIGGVEFELALLALNAHTVLDIAQVAADRVARDLELFADGADRFAMTMQTSDFLGLLCLKHAVFSVFGGGGSVAASA